MVSFGESLTSVDDWFFGYGFSYIFTREVALQIPYLDMNHGEDLKFFNGIRARNFLRTTHSQQNKQPANATDPNKFLRPLDPCGIALYYDRDGICLHTEHKQGTSTYYAQLSVLPQKQEYFRELVRTLTNDTVKIVPPEEEPDVDTTSDSKRHVFFT
eukprot:gnl/TRDRNA2_/TRDRNA2_117920_c0_seq2.p1 gnl/TRDRNA2_/TRDRNA2_117920_c0~~gnl/TRDRNA2_/TRDRNA2_117920_c0_seq2.p1  ORF type:complete len:183 (+),score=22.59 gnl/TRDRNA2_/TRDRNA2_117920_c0_seq2:79-549(+)